jgi:hypothetical protein
MFYLNKYEHASLNVPEPKAGDMKEGEACTYGEALVLSDGKFTKCTSAEKPEYIAMTSISASEKKRKIHAARVDANQLWEVPVTADPTELVEGDKVTLSTDALGVTATTGGTATVYSLNNASKAGDKILVRFE